tara:strand:- start:2088 stop:3092 length:1005 start_codon:yes stop_codon:yes gene_type:complete
MAYIGREPVYGAFEKQSITPDSSTTTFTLNHVVGSSSSILVSLAGVVQEPEVAYNLSGGGTSLVFASAPTSGDTCYVIFLGIAFDNSTLLSTGSITSQTDLGGAPATGDSLLLFDTDASALKEMTIANLFTSPTITTGVVATSLDLNGSTLILDADQDTTLTAGTTDDEIDIKIANTNHLKIKGSSGDTVLKPMVDAKDIIIQQFDGNELVKFDDGSGVGFTSFTRAALHPEATLTDASTISWDVGTSPVAKVTLGANRALGAGTNAQTGQFVSLLVIQDGTGSRTLTFNAAYEFKDDTAPTLTTTAAKGDLFVFRYNGSKFLEVGRNQNLTLS